MEFLNPEFGNGGLPNDIDTVVSESLCPMRLRSSSFHKIFGQTIHITIVLGKGRKFVVPEMVVLVGFYPLKGNAQGYVLDLV